MNNTNRLLIFAAISVALASPAQVYKYVDKDGKVQYTDRPPDDAKKTEIKVDPASDPTKTKTDDWRAKDKDVDARLVETRRKREACIKAREFLQAYAAYQEKHPRERWYHNGVLITPEMVDQARREVRDACAN